MLGTACAHAADGGPRRELSTVDAYLSAFALLDRHEIAALALTLGILCFAVVTAILLVRARRRLAEVETRAHDESIAAKTQCFPVIPPESRSSYGSTCS